MPVTLSDEQARTAMAALFYWASQEDEPVGAQLAAWMASQLGPAVTDPFTVAMEQSFRAQDAAELARREGRRRRRPWNRLRAWWRRRGAQAALP